MDDQTTLAALLTDYALRIEKAKTPAELGGLVRQAITEAYGAGVALAPTPPDAPDVRGDDPWAALRDEVDAMNLWYGERGNPCSAWVGWWPATGWYGGCGYDGEPMEEMADADGDTPEDAARNLVRLMTEYRERVDRQREEDNREP